LTALAQALDSK